MINSRVEKIKRSQPRLKNERSSSPSSSLKNSSKLPLVGSKESSQKSNLYKIPNTNDSYLQNSNSRKNSYYSVGMMKRPNGKTLANMK